MPKLTKRIIDQAVPTGADYMVWDSLLPGFGLRVSPRGTRTYLCQYRTQRGTQRRYRIGRHGPLTPDQARAEAQKVLALVQLGKDPGHDREEERKAATFETAYNEFLVDHASKLKPNTSHEYTRCGRVNLVPRFGPIKIKDIERRDVAGFHRDMRKAPYQANRILGILSKFFNWCELHGLRADNSNPCRHIKRYPEQKRERYLSGRDFGSIGDAIQRAEATGAISRDAANAIRLLMLTGARCSEILTLKWEYIDWEKGLALLPDSKTGQKPLYLSGAALQILEGIQRRRSNPHVIVGQKTGTCMTDLKRPWQIVCKAAGQTNLRLHDLRHSFASAAVCRGLSLPMIGKLLGHRSTQTTARYAHLADNPVMEANELVGDQIAKAMGMVAAEQQLPENVVRLRTELPRD